MSKQHVGIFGPGQSGKTTLAKAVSRAMAKKGIRSLVLDPNGEDWGDHTECFTDEAVFWNTVWREKSHFIICEEATETIGRDQELIPVFTRLRHRGHKLCVIGHSGTNLLPIMREQLHTLYLFRQSPKSSALWAEQFADMRILQASSLKQYEFLRCIMFGDKDGDMLIKRNRLTI